MDAHSIFFICSGIINAVTSFALCVFTLRKNKSSELNQSFSFFAFWVGYWALNYACWLSSPSEDLAIFFIRNAMVGAIFIPSSFTHFGIELLGKGVFRKKIIIWNYGLSVLFLLFSFSPLYISGVEQRFIFPYWPVPNILFHFMLAHFLLNIVYAHYILWKGMREAQGTRKAQIKYVFMGTLIGFIGGSTNYFVWYRIPIYPYLNLLVAIYVCTVAYAILRYKLLDIEVIIRKTVVFVGIVTVAACAIALPLGIAQLIIGKAIGVSPFWLMVSAILTTVAIHRPLDRWLTQFTDRFLFQKKYDYRKLLKDAAAGISQIKSLNQLLSLVVHFITMRLRTRNASMLLHDEKNNYFRSAFTRGYSVEGWPKSGHIFNEQDPLIDYLEYERQPIDIERVKEYIETGSPKTKKGSLVRQYDYKLIKVKMDELLAACCVPSFLGKRLLGVLVLGEKKSGDAYSDEDLAVLFTIAQESAIAIENARLYDEAIEKAKELETINDQLNLAQTNLIRALNEAETANKKLQVTQACLIVAEKNATMVSMAKAIGHEVNNPLSAVMSRVERINKERIKQCFEIEKKAVLLPEKDGVLIHQKDFERMKKLHLVIEDDSQRASRGAHRINAVIHTLTHILIDSKNEIGPLSLTVLCHEAIEATRFSTYEENLSGCDIDLNIAANIIILGNLEQLLQVFVNLIKNAYEAMLGQKERQIVISGDVDTDDTKMARIEVVDNGPGIPPEVLSQIWKQGFSTKVKKDDSIGTSGQGQGLYICKHIVESVHKGFIDVESEVGKGTKFIMKVPLAESGDPNV